MITVLHQIKYTKLVSVGDWNGLADKMEYSMLAATISILTDKGFVYLIGVEG